MLLSSLKVYLNFLGLRQIQDKVVSLAPLDQLAHIVSVVGFIVVADEPHYYRCNIHKLYDVVGAGIWNTVTGQEGEEHTPLWGLCSAH